MSFHWHDDDNDDDSDNYNDNDDDDNDDNDDNDKYNADNFLLQTSASGATYRTSVEAGYRWHYLDLEVDADDDVDVGDIDVDNVVNDQDNQDNSCNLVYPWNLSKFCTVIYKT